MGESFVKERGLRADNSTVSPEVASAAVDSHVGELLTKEKGGERTIDRGGARVVHLAAVRAIVILAARRRRRSFRHSLVVPMWSLELGLDKNTARWTTEQTGSPGSSSPQTIPIIVQRMPEDDKYGRAIN